MAIKQMTTEFQCLHPKYMLKGNKKTLGCSSDLASRQACANILGLACGLVSTLLTSPPNTVGFMCGLVRNTKMEN